MDYTHYSCSFDCVKEVFKELVKLVQTKWIKEVTKLWTRGGVFFSSH